MSFKIAIASGKGGTGKTTVAINLFRYFSNKNRNKVQLIDCDVEEPNDMIFFPDADQTGKSDIYQLIPRIDNSKCTFCRKCVEYCEFNAVVVIPPVKFTEVNSGLCHSCGACIAACPENAINEKPEPIGTVNVYKSKQDTQITEGRLKIGSAMQTMLIKELKKRIAENDNILIYDAPPGTSCPVVETIADMDFIVLVTEPTPFGLYDLKLMIELLSYINKPFGVIINKAGLGDQAVFHYLEKEKISLLGTIPFNREYANSYANGNLFSDCPEEIHESYMKITGNIENSLLKHERNNYTKR